MASSDHLPWINRNDVVQDIKPRYVQPDYFNQPTTTWPSYEPWNNYGSRNPIFSQDMPANWNEDAVHPSSPGAQISPPWPMLSPQAGAKSWTSGSQSSSRNGTPAQTPAAVALPPAAEPKRRGRQRSSRTRKSHNEIEQKYRNTVNTALQNLQRAVPALSPEPCDGDTERPQVTKAAILMGATAYIRQLELERNKLLEENHAFRDAVVRGRLLSELRVSSAQ